MDITAQLESLLFLATKPLSVKQLARAINHSAEEVRAAAMQLAAHYNDGKRGIRILAHGEEYQMTTAPELSQLVADFVEEELHGELTQPQLEALTVIAYRGPITKSELEQVRGVHCGLILRNLMIRGLVKTEEDPTKLQAVYTVTMDFLRTLGVASVAELPDYATLSKAEAIDRLLTPDN